MEQTQSRKNNKLMVFLYICLSFFSFYCACYRVPVGVKYILNCVIVALAIIHFLVKPDFNRMKYCGKFVALYFIPFFAFWLWSFVIWTLEFQSTDYIIRGTKNIVYMLTNILYLCSAFYLFGKKSIYYTFYAMCFANLAVFTEIGLEQGFGALFTQYFDLIISFAAKTGPVIRKMELHDMVYSWGPFILYFLFHKEKSKWINIIHLALAVFFFTLGLKRIAILAVGAAVLVGLFTRLLKDSNKRRFYAIIAIGTALVAFIYILSVKTGVFVYYMQKLGINLMGRDEMYAMYNNFYEVSPMYIGRGIRFIYNYGETHSQVMTIHNVYLELFIEVGFFMWFAWLWYYLYYRISLVAKRYSYAAAEFLFIASIYIFVTYATDNTFFHFPVNVSYCLLAMAWCYEESHKKLITDP